MRKLSLFSGIGGIDLAAHWAGMETVAFCEREPFPQKVLQKNFPGVPIYDDVCTLNREVLERDGIIGPDRAIDIISAGYPCQPFSHAGQRRGTEDDRHLWPEVARLLREIRPRWFVGENVAGHITLGLDDVLTELEGIGYTAQAFVIPASAVYASHRRDRVFILGHTERSGCSGQSWRRSGEKLENGYIQLEERSVGIGCMEREFEKQSTEDGEQSQFGFANGDKNVAYSHIERVEGRTISESFEGIGKECGEQFIRGCSSDRAERAAQFRLGGNSDELSEGLDRRGIATLDVLADFINSYKQPALMGQKQHDWEPPRVATGVKNRAARLKALGNAVDPLQIYPILAAIKFIDDQLWGWNKDAQRPSPERMIYT